MLAITLITEITYLFIFCKAGVIQIGVFSMLGNTIPKKEVEKSKTKERNKVMVFYIDSR